MLKLFILLASIVIAGCSTQEGKIKPIFGIKRGQPKKQVIDEWSRAGAKYSNMGSEFPGQEKPFFRINSSFLKGPIKSLPSPDVCFEIHLDLEEGPDGIQKLPGLEYLQQIIIEGGKITVEGAKELIQIHQPFTPSKPSSNLNNIKLIDCEIEEGAGELLSSLRIPISFHTSPNAPRSKSSKTEENLKEISKLQNLDFLGLKDARIKNSDLTIFSDLSKLQGLSLSGTLITDESVTDLAKLLNLQYLCISNTKLSQNSKAVEELKKSLPRCEIISENNYP